MVIFFAASSVFQVTIRPAVSVRVLRASPRSTGSSVLPITARQAAAQSSSRITARARPEAVSVTGFGVE